MKKLFFGMLMKKSLCVALIACLFCGGLAVAAADSASPEGRWEATLNGSTYELIFYPDGISYFYDGQKGVAERMHWAEADGKLDMTFENGEKPLVEWHSEGIDFLFNSSSAQMSFVYREPADPSDRADITGDMISGPWNWLQGYLFVFDQDGQVTVSKGEATSAMQYAIDGETLAVTRPDGDAFTDGYMFRGKLYLSAGNHFACDQTVAGLWKQYPEADSGLKMEFCTDGSAVLTDAKGTARVFDWMDHDDILLLRENQGPVISASHDGAQIVLPLDGKNITLAYQGALSDGGLSISKLDWGCKQGNSQILLHFDEDGSAVLNVGGMKSSMYWHLNGSRLSLVQPKNGKICYGFYTGQKLYVDLYGSYLTMERMVSLSC